MLDISTTTSLAIGLLNAQFAPKDFFVDQVQRRHHHASQERGQILLVQNHALFVLRDPSAQICR
jgi:hypothetical protein